MRAIAVILALALLAPCSEAAETPANCPEENEPQVVAYPSPRKDWTIYVRQEDHWSYSILARDKSGKVIKISKDPIPKDITVKWLSAVLAQISWPCGTGCLAMTFMNSHGELSRTSYKPLAVDVARQLLAEASVDENDSIDISAIFRTLKDPVQIVRLPNASLTAGGNPVIDARFLPNGKLFITYFAGSHGVETDLQIEVPK